MRKESERYRLSVEQLTDRAIGLAIALRAVPGADASVAPRCNSAGMDRPVSMVIVISALTIRTCRQISASIATRRNSVSWPAPGSSARGQAPAGHPRLSFVPHSKVVGGRPSPAMTQGSTTQQQLIWLFPRRPLADPTRCGVIDVVSRAIRSNPEAADDPLDQNIIRTVRCASAGARQAGAVVAAAAQARFNADARKWTQKTQMGRRPARIGGGSVGRPRRAPPARNPQSHSRFLRPFARICVEFCFAAGRTMKRARPA